MHRTWSPRLAAVLDRAGDCRRPGYDLFPGHLSRKRPGAAPRRTGPVRYGILSPYDCIFSGPDARTATRVPGPVSRAAAKVRCHCGLPVVWAVAVLSARVLR